MLKNDCPGKVSECARGKSGYVKSGNCELFFRRGRFRYERLQRELQFGECFIQVFSVCCRLAHSQNCVFFPHG